MIFHQFRRLFGTSLHLRKNIILINQNGKNEGVCDIKSVTIPNGFNLVQVGQNSESTPIYKLISTKAQKAEQSKAPSPPKSIKEIRLSDTITDNDLRTKLKHGVELLDKGHILKLSQKPKKRMFSLYEKNDSAEHTKLQNLLKELVASAKIKGELTVVSQVKNLGSGGFEFSVSLKKRS